MADNTSIVVRFESGSADDADSIYGSDGVDLSQGEVVPGASMCDGSTSDALIEIIVIPSPPDLNFTLSTTRGTLSEPTKQGADESETVEFDLEDEEKESNAIFDEGVTPTWSWEGDCINARGEVVPGPEVTYTYPNKFRTEEKIYGSLRVGGAISFNGYTLTLPARDEEDTASNDSGDAWSAKVVALWDGGLSDLQITPPDPTDAVCWASRSQVNLPDEDEDGEKCYKLTRYLDPCTGEQTKDDVLTQVACPEKDDDDTADPGPEA